MRSAFARVCTHHVRNYLRFRRLCINPCSTAYVALAHKTSAHNEGLRKDYDKQKIQKNNN